MPSSSSHTPPFILVLNIISIFLFFLFPLSFSIDVEGLALLSWKNTLNTSTNILNSWNPSDPNPCNWFGVSCNQNSKVVNLTLKTIHLQGSLPSNLQPLAFLKTLVISTTNLTGSIPKAFGDYHQLTFIDISKNQISGEIPKEISNLVKLEYLALNSNSLQGAIPSGIGNLSSLTYLTLYDNYLNGQIPPSIGNLAKLEVFRAGGNQHLKGPLPSEIGNCTKLVMLGLAETSISGNLPSTVGKLKKILTFAIYTSLLSGPIPKEFGNCTELTELFLYQNSLSGSIPSELGNLLNLQTLLLWQNSLVGSIPSEIGNCQGLSLMDLSLNLISGSIPRSIGKLSKLQQLQLSTNQLSSSIPSEISNCTSLSDLEIDNNNLSGEIDIDFTKLSGLTLFYSWKNRLTGNIPVSLAECQNLQSVDLSYNNLTGPIPKQLFELQNLTKLLLISNELSGFIPSEIGNCTNLFRLRLNQNNLAGSIPSEIGKLKNLNFLDISSNRLVGQIPPSLSGCENLEFLDLHSNSLGGSLPILLPKILQFIDISDNMLIGGLGHTIGSLMELTKFIAGKNRFNGEIPTELKFCTKLQLLDLGTNALSGEIPVVLGQFPALEISLNLSHNNLFGSIPFQLSGLTKLGTLDISYNNLTGGLDPLANLQNLVSLNISFNSFSGELPDTPFFHKLPLSDLTGNHGLYISSGPTSNNAGPTRSAMSRLKLTISILISLGAVLLLIAVYVTVRARISTNREVTDTWDITLYQQLDFSVDNVVRGLTPANVIGTGSSGVVYKVGLPTGDTLAVKKMWSLNETGAFQNEITTLGTIRHRNIVRLLGWGSNGSTKLLIYNYLVNGSLSGFLHRGVKGSGDWDVRYEIVLGVAHAVAYLHHDCVPAILHGDVKSMNVLLGASFEAYLADFGLARVLNGGCSSGGMVETNASSNIAGSYGYIAPEHASMKWITEKSDVYSYGVVLLEVLTGRHPLDPLLPGGAHLVQWVREHLASKRNPIHLLDSRLRGLTDSETQEMIQALSISLLCVSPRPDDRPTMKDVGALLTEIRRSVFDEPKPSSVSNNVLSPAKTLDLQGSSTCSFSISDCSS